MTETMLTVFFLRHGVVVAAMIATCILHLAQKQSLDAVGN